MPWRKRLWWGICVTSYVAGFAFVLLTPRSGLEQDEESGPIQRAANAKARAVVRDPQEPPKPSHKAPSCPIVLAKDPLRWMYLARQALADIESQEDLQGSSVLEALRYYTSENRVDDVYGLLHEMANTGRPWALDYLARLAEKPEKCLGANAAMNKHKLSLLALRALFSADTPAAAGHLKLLYKRAIGREYAASAEDLPDGDVSAEDVESALHRREAAWADKQEQGYLRWNLLMAAAESGTEYGAEMYWQAFASAEAGEKISWLRERIPMGEVLADGDVRTELLRSGLVDPSEDVRRAAADMLLEERHLQYPLGAARSSALLVEAFEAGGSAGQCAMLQDVGVALYANSSESTWIGNVAAIDTVLSLGLQSEDESVRRMAQQLEQEMVPPSEVERILARAAEDALWIQELVMALSGGK